MKIKSNFKDETGNRYGRLTVIEVIGYDKWKSIEWKCKCECGNETIVRGSSLRDGESKSCGCLRKEMSRAALLNKTVKREKYGYVCSVCKIHQPNSEFGKKKTYYGTRCNTCHKLGEYLRRNSNKTLDDWIEMNRLRAAKYIERALNEQD